MGKSTQRINNPKSGDNGMLPFDPARPPEHSDSGAAGPGVAGASLHPATSPRHPSEQRPGPLAEFPPAEPPPAPVPDPEQELSAYRSAVHVEAAERRPVRLTTLQVRRPNDQEYVRVRPGVDIVLSLFKDKTQGDKLYLFKREAEPFLPAKATRPYRIVLAKSLRAVVPFVWALPVPQDDMGRTWHESADQAARDAETQWVKLVADMVGGCYVAYPAAGELPEAEWPAEALADLILLAFKNQRIDGPDHPVIRSLNGEMV